MKILLINYGSSSLKYNLYYIDDKKSKEQFDLLAYGSLEMRGVDVIILNHYPKDKPRVTEVITKGEPDIFIKIVIDTLSHPKYGVIKSKEEISAVGHRVVHGGEYFSQSVIITPEVKEKIRECFALAPLHNPFNLKGIELTEELLPGTVQVAIFDTAFHAHIPPYAYLYGIPYSFYKRFKIRRYGFHGASHYYVSHRVAELLKLPIKKLKIISCHLGNGASIAAIKNGCSIDTSMGLTPLDGLVMGTRCGSIDPAIVLEIMALEGLSSSEVYNLLNRRSGLLGISGISNDMRDIIKEMNEGSTRAKLAFDVYVYSIQKYIGAYVAAMNGVDVIIFAGGVGENSPLVREKCCENLKFLGVKLDRKKNEKTVGIEQEISIKDSKIKVFCIPTNESLVMVEDTYRLVKGEKNIHQ